MKIKSTIVYSTTLSIFVLCLVLYISWSINKNIVLDERSTPFNPNKWQINTIEHISSNDFVGRSCSIKVNPVSNQPQICYYYPRNGIVKYATKDVNDWKYDVIDSQVFLRRKFVSFDFNKLGIITAAYNYPIEKLNLEVVKLSEIIEDKNSFDALPVLSRITSDTSIVLNACGEIVVLVVNLETNQLMTCSKVNNKWKNEIVVENQVDPHNTLAVISKDRQYTLCIAYYDDTSHKLTYLLKKNNQWEKDVIDYNLLDCNSISIGFNSKNEPSVLYLQTNSVLKLAEKVNGLWNVDIISSDVAYSSSMAIDSKDRYQLAYNTSSFLNNNNDYLVYEYQDTKGGKFLISKIEKVKSIMSLSIALDKKDKPHICYTDLRDSSLKYAYITN